MSLPMGGGGTRLICFEADTGDVNHTHELDAFVQAVPAPQGPWVALSHLSSGFGGFGLRFLNSAEHQFRDGLSKPAHSIDWLPDGQRVIVSTDRDSGLGLVWHLIDLERGESTELAAFWPTPDEAMRLRFSSQFSRSHPRLSQDGTRLCYASFGDPTAADSEAGQSFIYELMLQDAGSEAQMLDKGSLAVYIHGVKPGGSDATS